MKTHYDVVVVGLGPVGAVLAGLLGQAGLRVLVIEKSTEVYPLPRAAHFDHEIMRVFQHLGIASAVLQHAREAGPYEFRNAAGELLMVPRSGNEIAVSGWAYAYMFNQPGIERALRDRLAEMPNVTVALGAEFLSLDQEPEQVSVGYSDEHGNCQEVGTAYVVGCDGAWSPVRETLGIDQEDYQFDEPWLVIDTTPADPTQMRLVSLQICDPARPTTCVAMGPGCHRWEFMLLPGEQAEEVLRPEFIQELLKPWNVDVTIQRQAVYRFHALVAKEWRKGRVFLAGDAAHQMPPFAGQGMCSGVRDAANLAWKLIAVMKDSARDSILDTYQLEREKSVCDYIELAIEMGRVVCTLDPEEAAERDAKMISKAGRQPEKSSQDTGRPGKVGGHFLPVDELAGTIFPQFIDARGTRFDDIAGIGAWLIGAHPISATVSGLTVMSVDDPAIASFSDELRGWLGRHGLEAVLVRPDRYIFGSGHPEALVGAWSHSLYLPALNRATIPSEAA